MEKTKLELIEQLDETIYENTNREITPSNHKGLIANIIDSMALNTDLSSSNQEFVIKKFILPAGTNTSKLHDKVNKYFNDYGRASDINNSVNYSRCIFTFTQDGVIRYKARIADYTDFFTVANNTLIFDGGNSLEFDVFVKVSFNISKPRISKFWNYNEGYAILKRYALLNQKVAVNPSLPTEFVQQLWTWLRVEEAQIPAVITEPKTIWFQTTLKAVYNGFDVQNAPAQGIRFVDVENRNRYMMRSNGTLYKVDTVAGIYDAESIFSNRVSIVVKITDLDYTTLQNYDIHPSNNRYCEDNLVRIHALRFKDPNNNRRYYSMLVKPIGIDTIIIGKSNINTSTDKLYGIFYNENTTPIIREIVTFTPQNTEQAVWGVKKSELIKYMMPRKMQKADNFVNDVNIKKCRLFYIDVDSNASKFSKAIIVKTRTRGANIKLAIEK